MAIIMKTFHFVVYILVIDSCLKDMVASVEAEDDPSFRGNVNRVDRHIKLYTLLRTSPYIEAGISHIHEGSTSSTRNYQNTDV